MSDRICKDKYVSVTYTITDDQSEVLERIDLPINYIQGRESQIIYKIEQALEGSQVGDEVRVTLAPSEAFGDHQPELTFTDDVNNVPEQFRHIGAEVEFKNDHGESKTFRVIKVTDSELTVDGNHPFAGKHITYNLKVALVRDATQAEIEHGVANMPILN